MKRNRLLILFLILYLTNWTVTINYSSGLYDTTNIGFAALIAFLYAAISLLKLLRKTFCYHRHGIRVLRLGDIRCLFQTTAYLLVIPFLIHFKFEFEDADMGMKAICSIFTKQPIEEISSVALVIGKTGSLSVALLLLLCIVIEQFNQQINHKINFNLNRN